MRLLDRHECAERLRLIFPVGVVDDPPAVSGPLAGAAIYVAIYCGSLDGRDPIRPSTVLWMCDGVADRAAEATPEQFDEDRSRWRKAARSHNALTSLLRSWGIDHHPWYADTTREPLRDETFRAWLRFGAMSHDASLPTTSPRPAWTLRGDFASLFKPALRGDDLDEAIRLWQGANLGTVGRARIRLQRERGAASHSVEVRLPSGLTRSLAPGDSSLILKGVIETVAPRLMDAPSVVAISQSRRKIDMADDELLRDLGLSIQASTLLPDALLFDAATERFWFVEAVATDGEIHDARKQELLRWADEHGIEADHCGFLTGFLSRTHEAFRRRAARLAWGTHAWFLDEPDSILRLDALPDNRT